ncbi:MAG: PA0069 family radical SAM protein [Flavobacteriales bacterium]|nr:PA0069 family radical SAM protein [Flavobacteriales bacterium]
MSKIIKPQKGRGAQHNTHNRFEKNSYHIDSEHLEYCRMEEEEYESEKTKYQQVFPKTIVTKNNSPDVPFNYSINPYQGCEHGCVYCYARNSHEYWGYSAGKDFEKIILVKHNAVDLLSRWFHKRGYEPELIALSGNTDCYQPAERKYQLTRRILQTFLNYRHPVGIITKNSLILRDLDILKELNKHNLVRITMSITTLNEELRRTMEPRTASIKQRLKAVQVLSDAGIPVNVNLAPIIHGLNNHEVFDLVKTSAEHGAKSVNYILARLNGQIAEIFSEWVHQAYPERAEKVLNQIKATHNGKLNESQWKSRMRGEGEYADQVKMMFNMACKRFLPPREKIPMNYDDFTVHPKLF